MRAKSAQYSVAPQCANSIAHTYRPIASRIEPPKISKISKSEQCELESELIVIHDYGI